LKLEFIATRKNADPTQRELYELDYMLDILGFKRAFMDLGLQTVASVTPPEHAIRFTDEYLGPIDYRTDADVVCLSAKTSCITRAYEVADELKRRGKTVVLGGIHASLRPEESLQHAHVVVKDEAEEIWPKVVDDLASKKTKQIYKAADYPDMARIPIPSFAWMDHRKYFYRQLQTTRGCPFMCRFCSVPDISGQAFRCKPIENIVREIRALPRGGGPIANARPLYIVDDNFISRPSYTKDLLRALVPLRQRGEIMDWSAETTLNVARDEELLDLFVAAGCTVLIIGFESVSEATLKDMDKGVNFCMTYQEAMDRILSRNVSVVGNFIVGFDTDDLRVFKDTLDFIERNGIMYPFFSILTPMPGTKLFDDMAEAGRLDHQRWELYDTRHVVFEPKQMTREQLMDGYVYLYEKAYGPDATLPRLEKWWGRKNAQKGSSMAERLFIAARTSSLAFADDREDRRFYKDALKLLLDRKMQGEVGQLLYMLDAHHFANFLKQYNSAHAKESYRLFSDPDASLMTSKRIAMQWDKVERKRAARGLAVISA
jgi:radical SAM superfamily enzyme YgiQ (UPF0313 family)